MLPLYVLRIFSSRSTRECSSGVRRQRQEESITIAIQSWCEPGGSLHLVRDTLADVSPPLLDANDEHDLSERNIKQCKRKICDGHYTMLQLGFFRLLVLPLRVMLLLQIY